MAAQETAAGPDDNGPSFEEHRAMLKKLLNRILSAPPAEPEAPPAALHVPAAAPANAVATPPGDVARADALITEGNALEDAGQAAQAEALYRDAVRAAPGHARAHLNLGIVLAARGDDAGALAAYDAVLAIDSQHPFGNYNLARLVFVAGDHERARSLLDTALKARPEFPQALVLQANVLEALGQTPQAIESMSIALRLQPDDDGAWFNQAVMLHKLNRFDEAEAAVRRALEGSPDQMGAHFLLSALLRDLGFANDALPPLRTFLEKEPEDWVKRSFELILMIFGDGIPTQDIVRRHLEFGVDLERAVPARFEHSPARPEPARRLRVGYFSCDFKLHPVPFFLLPVLEHHDRTQVEVFCYSFGETVDPITDRARALSDHWRDVVAKSEEEIADAINADGIDVLVDLVGHTGIPRLGVYAQKPATVQVAWLGYLCTTGLTRMDFRLCDRRTDPIEIAQPLHTEKLVHLPFSQWAYRPVATEPIDPIAPVERNDHVTFGSFNAPLKISPAMCRRWGEVLVRVPGSRLLVTNVDSKRKREAILRDIASAGADPQRVEFLARVPLGEYLGLFNQVDIALDSFPYGGGTTTFDSLWMGVPVVAAVGEVPVSRSAASILLAFGLGDWVAQSIEDYVDVAVARASDRPGLAQARGALRARMQASPLLDVARFTRALESAYRNMWLAKGTPADAA